MTDSELIQYLQNEFKKKEQYKDLCDSMIATLLLNFNKGRLLANSTEAFNNLGMMINDWFQQFKKFEEGEVLTDLDVFKNMMQRFCLEFREEMEVETNCIRVFHKTNIAPSEIQFMFSPMGQFLATKGY